MLFGMSLKIFLLLANLVPMLATANRVGILKGNSASTPSEDGVSGIQQHASYNLSDLSNMCPFADICDYQGREPPKKGLDSCCLPCSCDSTCGQIGNCCDKQDNIGHMCHYPIVQQWDPNKLRDINMYFMVDKCLDGSKRDCTEMDAAPWGSLYPVYDLVSQMSFYNPECAQCNGVKEFTEWELALLYNGEQVNNERIRRALRGEAIEESTVNFIPPRTMNILRNICSDKLIHRCNVTGSWTNYDAELEESCLRWTSPVLTGARQNLLYANVFCMLCNTRIHYEPDETCLAFETGRDTSLQVAQTFTIDYRRVAALVDQDAENKMKSTGNGGCDRGMVKHVSEPECRTLLCPNGFVASVGICRPLISKLLKHEYFVQLQLTPSSDQLPPRSYLDDLTDEERKEPGTWLDAKGAPLDTFGLYSKTVNINDTEYAEELVVKIGKEEYPLNLSRAIQNIQTAIAEPWTLRLKGKVFQYFVQFYRYAEYVPSTQTRQKENVLNHLTLSGEALSYEYSSPDEFYDNDVIARTKAPYPLKKTNFCKRVRLKRSEWMAGFNEILLNTSKEVFGSDKRLGDSEFDLFLDEMGEPTVEICVEDFNPDYQEQQATAASSGILVTTTMLSHTGILILTLKLLG